jgi:hypothetical protein
VKRLSRLFDDNGGDVAFAALVWEDLSGFNDVAFLTRRKLNEKRSGAARGERGF